MAKDNPEWEDPWAENPYFTGRFTGRKGNEGYAIWNPETDSIEKYTLEDYRNKASDWKENNTEGRNRNLAVDYINKFGEWVYGYRPEHTRFGMINGEQVLLSGRDPNAGNSPSIPDPNNNTPVPWTIPNPEYNPNKWVDNPFQPKPDSGPDILYPGSGGPSAPIGGSGGPSAPVGGSGGSGGGDPFRPPSGSVQDSVFDNPKNWEAAFGSPVETDFRTDFRLGEDSPWGNEGVEGGNRDFYRQQLNNLRAQEQGYQQSAIGAALRRQAAANQPAKLPADPFDWAYGGKGLPTVGVAGGTMDNPTAYALRSYVQPGETSNADILRKYGDFDTGNMERWLAPNEQGETPLENRYNWSRANNPQDLINTLSRDPAELATSNYDFLSRIYNDMFVQQGIETPEGGGPSAAPGYALPIGVS